MVQATGSHAGKSVFVAGLCRLLRRRGWRVAPFKPQNMANNAAVTEDGGEIARAQAMQCIACGCEPCIDMNPVLLKPQAGGSAQLVVGGRRQGEVFAKDYPTLRTKLLQPVRESYRRLRSRFDVVVVEGAGSPAELNLRAGDIANMGFACAEKIPVVVLGDVERGGSLAALCGTHLLLSQQERDLVRGYVINKFRGDVSLFDEALSLITERTGWDSLGIVPWFADLAALPDEDSLGAGRRKNNSEDNAENKREKRCRVAVLRYPYASNVDDLDPLLLDENFAVTFVEAGGIVPQETDLLVLLGSKSVLSDLSFVRKQGWDIDVSSLVRRGGYVLGICGGYQMLGEVVEDVEGLEGAAGSARGLGLLAVETRLTRRKRLRRRGGQARLNFGGEGGEKIVAVEGYEMHKGLTKVREKQAKKEKAMAGGMLRGWLSEGSDCGVDIFSDMSYGVISSDGRVMGCYWHGLFCGEDFRKSIYEGIVGGGRWRSGMEYSDRLEDVLEGWADHLEEHCDLAALLGDEFGELRMGGRVVEGVGLENR